MPDPWDMADESAAQRIERNPKWLEDANAGKTMIKNPDGTISTVRAASFEADGRHFVAPQVRLIDGKPVVLPLEQAKIMALDNHDAIPFDTQEEADAYANNLHQAHEKKFRRNE